MSRDPEYGPTDIPEGPDVDGVPIKRPIITSVNDFDDIDMVASWDTEPEFLFADQIDAMQVLDLLGEQVRGLRRQVAHTLRYVKLAARAAHGADLMSKNHIVSETGLAKQTILDMFKDDPE